MLVPDLNNPRMIVFKRVTITMHVLHLAVVAAPSAASLSSVLSASPISCPQTPRTQIDFSCFVQAVNRQAELVEGTPFGARLAEFGMVSNLPQVWWSVFPFKRRHHPSL